MNQEKIGQYIAEKRKKQNLTQTALAEKLGVTDKSVSNWENGKNMPDLSLFNSICKELNITMNELMSGEDLAKEQYQKKLEENIINLTLKTKKDNAKKRLYAIIIIIVILSLTLIGYLIYNYVELDVEFNENIMHCEFTDNNLIYEIKGVSVFNTHYIEKVIDNHKYFVFHSTIYLFNKNHLNYEYYESMSASIGQEKLPFGMTLKLYNEATKYENITVFYTDLPLKKVSQMSDAEFKELIPNLVQMCSTETISN